MESHIPHRNAAACIAALRERIADLEFRVEQLAQRPHERRTLRPPKYQMPVVLDGERLPLAEAAGKLGLPPKRLYERIYARLSKNRSRKGVRVSGVDIRRSGVDTRLRPWGAQKLTDQGVDS